MSSINEFIEIKEITREEIVTEQLNELVAVRERMATIAEQFDVAIAKLQEEKAEAIGTELPTVEKALVKFIKAETVFVNHTVKGTKYNEAGLGQQAVWSKGRTSWDTKKLVGYIPEIKDEELRQKFSECQKVSKPSVSIRVIKKAKEQDEMESLF